MKIREILPKISVMYIGAMILIVPKFMYIPDMYWSLVNSIGMGVIVYGIVWLFSDKQEKNIDKAINIISGNMSDNVEEVKLIEDYYFYETAQKHIRYGDIDILISNSMVGRWIDGLEKYIDNYNSYHSKTRILITGIKKENISTEETTETNVFIQRIEKNDHKNNIEIKLSSECTSNTQIISMHDFYLFIPFSPKVNKLIFVKSKNIIEHKSYKSYFNSLWSKSEEYSNVK